MSSWTFSVELWLPSRCRSRLPANCVGTDPPHGIADVVSDQQRSGMVEREPDGTSLGFLFILSQEARYHVLRRTAGMASPEGHIDHFVTVERASIPTAVLSDKDTAAIARRKIGGLADHHTQGCDVGAQGVVRRYRLRNQVRALRLYTN